MRVLLRSFIIRSRIESSEDTRKEYLKLLKEVWEKTNIFC